MKPSRKPAGKILIVLLCLALAFGQCLSAAAGGETVYTCGEAAEMLRIHADAYRSPALTAEEILNGAVPDAPLTMSFFPASLSGMAGRLWMKPWLT